jgi:TPR repeat protein
VAQNRVARLYATGRVFAVDPVEAMKWHILARQGGRSDAWLDDFIARLPQATQEEAQTRARDFKPN